MKCLLQLENFTGETVHSVYQDFSAKIFTKNLAAAMIRGVEGGIHQFTHGHAHLYKANFTNALAMMKAHIVVLFNRDATAITKCIEKIQTQP